MLLGYNPKTGNIEFMFSDSSYLKRFYPNNTAKISNFWRNTNHGLTEIFIEERDYPGIRNYQSYKIIDGKIIRKEVTI